MKSLNSKITNSIFFMGTILIVFVYVSLYFISIDRSKDFHIGKLENTINLIQKDLNDKTRVEQTIKNLINSDKYIKKIDYNGKEYKGISYVDNVFFKKTIKLTDSKIDLYYGERAMDKYISALKIRMFIVALMFYILVFFIYKQISKLLNPFQEIINYFEDFSLNKKFRLNFKEKNVAREFSYVRKSINKMQSNIIDYSVKIQKLAFTDTLTGLPNRESYYRIIKQLWNSEEHFSVCFMDLDGFKFINDSYGHNIGDILLQKIAEKLNHLDIYRIGGDEFVIIINSINKEVINNISEEILYLVNEDIYVHDYVLNISTSIGISIRNEETYNMDSLLKESDIAMYVSKREGKNKVTYFNSQMYLDIKNKIELINNIRHATENEEFTFFVQPQVSLSTGKIVGGEALIRWNFKNEIISPFSFIEELEASKYIFAVGNQIIKKVMKYTNELHIKNIDFGRISINLAEKQITNSSFIIDIIRLLKETNGNPNFIEFEITERWKDIENEIIRENLEKLKDLGFSISVDDFGEDNSSFKRTDILPIEQIKLDKNFADRLFDTPSSVNSIKAILTYAELNNVKFIVEGVETKEQVDKLQEIGVELIQGYYYYKPMNKKDFEKLLRK